jgi:protein-tyrosine-phosphatase
MAQMIVAMEPCQIVELRRRYPQLRDRFFLLPLFSERDMNIGPFDRYHLADPFGQGTETFERCYSRIDTAVEAMADFLSP